MPPDVRAMQAQHERVKRLVEEGIRSIANRAGVSVSAHDVNRTAEVLVEAAVQFWPPDSGQVEIRMITMSDLGVGGGRSRRVGNVRLNWRPLFEAGASLMLALPAAVKVPWTAPFVGLLALSRLISAMDIPITEREAMVAWVLWQARDPGNGLPKNLLQAVNHHMQRTGRPLLSAQVLLDSLRMLEGVGFVEFPEGDASRWSLRDWVNIHYS